MYLEYEMTRKKTEGSIMRYDVTIDKKLFETYGDIRLGLMRFNADVKNSDENIESWIV